MIFPLFRRTRPDTISTLYGMIVAQARLPCFYREYTVADTVNGRFELLVLHLTMLLDRLAEDLELRELGQALFDRFCTDMDHNLREMGVGDLSVPKQMQRVGGSLLWPCAGLQGGARDRRPGEAHRSPDAEYRQRQRIAGPGSDGPPCGLYEGSGT